MAITIDGVTYRNLPEQVEKNKTDIETLKANIEGIKKNAFTDVDTTEYPTLEDFLQSTGEEGIIYLYPDGTNFKQYIWEGEEWRFIGDTELDISNMMTTDTDQSVGGVKTIETDLAFNRNGNDPITWHIQPNVYNGLDIVRSSTVVVSFASSNFAAYTITPFRTNIDSLGSATQRWNTAYVNTINFGTKVSGRTTSCKIELDIYDGVGIWSNNVKVLNIYDNGIFFIKPLMPIGNGMLDIGSSTNRVKDIYLSGNISDGTNSVSVDEIGKTKLYKHTFTNVTPPQDVSQDTLFVIDNDPTQILLTTNINGIRLSNALKIGMPSGTNKIYAFGLQTGLFTITGYILGSTASTTFDFAGAAEEITEY